MGFGDFLAEKWAQASDAGKAAARAVGDTAKSAYDHAVRKAVAVQDYVHEKAVAGYQAVKNAPADVASAVDRGVRNTKLGVIESRYENARKALGQEKAGSPVKMCAQVMTRCAKLKDARNKAQLADDSYSDKPPPRGSKIGGYRRLDPKNAQDAAELRKKLGVTKADLEPKGLDFRARVYAKSVNGKTEYVIAYRGTQTGADWKENARQGSGMVDASTTARKTKSSYQLAVRLANKAAEKTEENGDSLSYTGHSLGGGMASAAAAMTSSQTASHATATYNAAGLNANTLGGAYPNPPAPVDTYFTPTDPLSALQDNRPLVLGGVTKAASAVPVVGPFLAGAVGGWVLGNEAGGTPVMPKAYENRHVLPFPPNTEPPDLSVEGLKKSHGMQLVIDGIDAERADLKCPG